MKNIVICCDGTGNEFGRNNTNVVLTYMLAQKDEQQVAYYDPGVGTGGWQYEEDSGGWYDERGLSNLTLHWMLGKAAECDLRLNRDKLAEYKPNAHDPAHDSYDGFWKLRGRKTRLIPPRARIHRSVFERMKSGANDYSPTNLPEEYDTVG